MNLTDQAWIPCAMSRGEACELSLADTLIRAHEIREIFDESPLVTVALHRLLLAILHRNFGPGGKKPWFELWKRGRWDENRLSQYFAKWRGRFDLFHPERPFYQVPEMEGAARQPVAILFQEMAAGNNTTLFDHSFETSASALSAAGAARGVVARQAYSIGFGKSNPFYFSDSPLIRGFTVLLRGRNLFETLALNLVRYDEDHPFSGTGKTEDLPCWEQHDPAAPKKAGSLPAGYLDYLTWQSRRIHLYPEADGRSVRFCQLQQNLKLAEEAPKDPFKCYRKDEKRGWIARGFREDKALWRDSHTLMEVVPGAQRRPAVFDWVAELAENSAADEAGVGPYFSFSAFGLATDFGKAASVILWRDERLPLPAVYLWDGALRGKIAQAIDYCEKTATDLRDSVWTLAHTMFQPLEGNGNQGRSDDASRVAEQLAPRRIYWPALEPPFIELITELAETAPDVREQRLREWRRLVRRTAAKSLDQITREFFSGARELRAAAETERVFWRKIRERLEPGEAL